jgi:hypothetical protein
MKFGKTWTLERIPGTQRITATSRMSIRILWTISCPVTAMTGMNQR